MKKMRHMKRNALVALVLSVTMLLTLMPGLVFGVSDAQSSPDTVSSSIDYPTVNFTDVAPFLPPVSGGVRMLRAPLAAPRAAANFAANDTATDSGMKISKTATANADGSYTITLEAFATGSKTTTVQEKDIPTDIILVLDQSGSMADDIGRVQYTAYTGNNTQNKSNYEKRHNGGSANLWHKLPDGSFVSVSVTLQQTITYNKITKGRNDNGSNGYTNYWENRNNLYTYVNGEIKKVVYTRERDWFGENYKCTYALEDGTILNQNNKGSRYSPTFQNTDDGYLYLPVADESQNVYTYTYTDTNGTTQTIGTSTGANTKFEPAFYQRSTTTSGGGSRLNALKSAANAFASAVATKAAGEDGDITTTADNINHRIAVVGYADTDWDYDYNTGVFIGNTLNRYEDAAAEVYSTALQDMSTTNGKNNVTASLNALQASVATRTDYGLIMAKGILDANPVPAGETRNRVVIVFTDGSPTSSNGFERDVANSAISTANAIKAGETSVYSIGIFSGADASTAGKEPDEDYYDGFLRPNYTDAEMSAACNWFMQKVSSNNGTPRYPSYYLSAGDSASLNNIFQQISNQIETGGAETTLGSETVVKDIISPYFTLPAGTTASGIRIDTYAYTRKDGNTYPWSGTSGGPGGATATVDGDQVSVTGFDFSENWCGTETDANGNTTVRGKKLVISFTVDPKSGFLGGNNVPTNAGAGVYENKDSETPVREFPQPTVNVPIQPVTVAAQDYNVYLLGGLTASQLQSDSTVQVGSISLDLTKATDSDHPYGLEPWQTAYVDITVSITGPDGSPVTDLAQLRADTSYAVSVTVSPKTEPQADSSGTPAAKQSGSATGKVSVFKPTLTYEDGTVYYGDTFDRATLPGYRTSTSWFHNGTDATAVSMTGAEPKLNSAYSYDTTRLTDIVNTKQDIPVKATISIGDTNITADTAFLHTNCAGETWSHTSGDPAFLLHVRTCALTVTKTGGADGEPYVFNVYRNGDLYTQVTVVGSSSVSLYELPVGKYTIAEDTGWSWRYDATYMPDGCALTAGHNSGSIICTNTLKNDRWLNGFSDVIANIFGIRH